jgi:hypothetical protein
MRKGCVKLQNFMMTMIKTIKNSVFLGTINSKLIRAQNAKNHSQAFGLKLVMVLITSTNRINSS